MMEQVSDTMPGAVQNLVYLDYAATTPMLPEVEAAMQQASWANPASEHALGRQAKAQLETARQQIAQIINADSRELVFTSGATEANNLALRGAAEFYRDRGRHIVTVQTEHKAVLDTCAALERDGFEVTYLPVGADGLLRLSQLQAALRDDTILVSVMQVNNETGVMQPLAAIAALLAEHTARLHVDAAQGFAKLPLDWASCGIDYLSVSAHKCYGPKGIGGLFIRRQPRARLVAQQHGGGQEMSLRSGTLSVPLAAGFAAACQWWQTHQNTEYLRVNALNGRLFEGLQVFGAVPNVSIDSVDPEAPVAVSPYVLNVRFPVQSAESLQVAVSVLAGVDVAASSGSACASASNEPSAVLRAMGLSVPQAESALRLSFGWQTTAADIDAVNEQFAQALQHLQCIAGGMSP